MTKETLNVKPFLELRDRETEKDRERETDKNQRDRKQTASPFYLHEGSELISRVERDPHGCSSADNQVDKENPCNNKGSHVSPSTDSLEPFHLVQDHTSKSPKNRVIKVS